MRSSAALVLALGAAAWLVDSCAGSLSSTLRNTINTFDLLMPRVAPNAYDNHLCMRSSIHDEFYIVGFAPRASMELVHQMTLYGCAAASGDSVWRCNEPPGGYGDPRRSPCSNGSQVVYGWGRNASGFQLPRGVGFRVGPRSPVRHLVLQVHYLRRYTADGTLIEIDGVGVTLSYTRKRMAREAGVLLLSSLGRIPGRSVERLEVVCAIRENKTIHPFAFRVHTHKLGELVSCYAVRQGRVGDAWTTLAKARPERPQGFLPVRDAAPLRAGDILAARCTHNNSGARAVRVGTTERDEICNLELMYWTEGAPLRQKACVSAGPPRDSWAQSIHHFRNIPDLQASIL